MRKNMNEKTVNIEEMNKFKYNKKLEKINKSNG